MPRGKNYMNQDGGVFLQASNKKKASSMEQCFYGAACTREGCIYRHDGAAKQGQGKKSTEPCMAFLAGKCTFSHGACRKRHPGKAEADKLRAKFAKIKCRHGDKCQTVGCLYVHPGDENNKVFDEPSHVAFPPLAGSNGSNNGSMEARRPSGGSVTQQSGGGSAWQPTAWGPQQQQPPQVISQPPPPYEGGQPAVHRASWPQQPPTPQAYTTVTPPSYAALAAAAPPQPQQQQPQQPASIPPPPPHEDPSSPSTSSITLNVNAREFVPGNPIA